MSLNVRLTLDAPPRITVSGQTPAGGPAHRFLCPCPPHPTPPSPCRIGPAAPAAALDKGIRTYVLLL